MTSASVAVSVRVRRRLRHFDLDVAFEVAAGDVLVVVGPSGAGKTSILNCVAGLDSPAAGRICLGPQVVFDSDRGIDLRPERRRVGYVFQDYALFPHLTVFGNVAYGLRAGRWPAPQIRSRVAELLGLLRIGELAEAHPGQLSGGEQQRVALARALAAEPQLLLLDEPIGALDSTSRKVVRRELRQLLRRLGITAILVTHDYEDALVLGQRILVMDKGRTSHAGTHEELLHHPRSRFVADLTGVNYVEGVAAAGDTQPREIRIGGQCLYAVTECVGEVSVSFFPSDVTLTIGPPHSSARNVMQGTIAEVANLGGRLRVHVAAPLPVVAEMTPASFAELGLAEGRAVYVSFKATAVRVSP